MANYTATRFQIIPDPALELDRAFSFDPASGHGSGKIAKFEEKILNDVYIFLLTDAIPDSKVTKGQRYNFKRRCNSYSIVNEGAGPFGGRLFYHDASIKVGGRKKIGICTLHTIEKLCLFSLWCLYPVYNRPVYSGLRVQILGPL